MKKILIVEDDQLVANIYRNKFSLEGFQVEVANEGNVGLDLARTFRPDAVILDLMLPRMTGVDFMKRVRAEPGFEQLPVIVFSNTYLTNMVQDAWKAGATKCLSKANCTPKQVIEVLRSILNINGRNGTSAPTPKNLATGSIDQQGTAHTHKAASPPAPAPSQSDTVDQTDLLTNFGHNLPASIAAIRSQLQALIKAGINDGGRVKLVHDLYRHIHILTGSAGVSGAFHVSHIAAALEALLRELYEKPSTVNASSLRTIAAAVDFLDVLASRKITGGGEDALNAKILVVDDEAISRRAISHALEKAKLKCQAVEDPLAALELLNRGTYDLIFLDIDMPGMNGFELCAKLRGLPTHKKTPVVFVTSLNDFESRANSTMSGGNDFIAKPFLFMELAVKALVHLFRSRLAPRTGPTLVAA
jgi:DNA-binding response OmpR family regulator